MTVGRRIEGAGIEGFDGHGFTRDFSSGYIQVTADDREK
jgi:hypothetical protein